MCDEQEWREWRDETERRLVQLLPHDLKQMGASRYYVVLDIDCEHSMPGVKGFSVPLMCRRFQQEIGERFNGNGPAIFIATREFGSPLRETMERANATVLHEVTHELQEQWPVNFYQLDVVKAVDCGTPLEASRTFSAAQVDWESECMRMIEQRKHHGQDFIRRLVLLALHAERNGWKFRRGDLCNWNLITFADFPYLAELLYEDVQYMQECPRAFNSLHNIPEPIDFRFAYLNYEHMINANYSREMKFIIDWHKNQKAAEQGVVNVIS